MSKRRANIQVLAGGDLVVWPSSRTLDYLWIATEPVVRLPGEVADGTLLDVVQAALGESHVDVERPQDLKAVTKLLLDGSRVSSQRAFYIGARWVAVVEEEPGMLVVKPSRRDGYDFTVIPDAEVHLNHPNHVELAKSIREAIDQSL